MRSSALQVEGHLTKKEEPGKADPWEEQSRRCRACRRLRLAVYGGLHIEFRLFPEGVSVSRPFDSDRDVRAGRPSPLGGS
jgi:hypothetical protein